MLKTINKYKVPIVIGVAAGTQTNKNESGKDLTKLNKTFDSSLPRKQFGLIVGTQNFGILNTYRDNDKRVRRVRQTFDKASGQAQIPGFAYLIARKALTNKIDPPAQVQMTNYHLDTQFPVLSFEQVLRKARENDSDYFKKHFENKIVLIAINNVSDDIHATPLGDEISGIFIHAHTINNHLYKDYLSEFPNPYVTVLIIFLALLAGISSAHLRLAYASLLFVFFSGGYFLLSLLLFKLNYVIPLVAPLLALLLAYGSTYIYRFTVEDKNKRRLAQFFSSYVNEKVVEEILQSDQPIALEGSRKNIAILFSDIRGFTTYSEKHPAEIVVKILNEYFTAMTEVIWEHNGTVDKFIGDGLMVFFGAPTAVHNPTLNALKAASAMRKRLAELNHKWQQDGYLPVDNGIGIHSGEAIVGNIGSDKKREYTAIGDAVNIASRIEGLTKTLDSPILMSSDSYKCVKGNIRAKSKGKVPIKGHTDIEVFALLDIKGG